MSKTLVFDSSSLISLALNNLLWILKPLKEIYGGQFIIPDSVKHELVDVPFRTQRFKLEAMVIAKLIEDGVLTRADPIPFTDLSVLCNSVFSVREKSLTLVQEGELEALAVCLAYHADALVVDERTTRLFVEKPSLLQQLLQRKMRNDVIAHKELLRQLTDTLSEVHVFRSVELVCVAFEQGFFDSYVGQEYSTKDLLEALLWGLRLRGCSITTGEIMTLLHHLG